MILWYIIVRYNQFLERTKQVVRYYNDENHETGQIQVKDPSGEGRRLKWRRTKASSGER